MKQICCFSTFLLCLASIVAHAQNVGIGTLTPSAKLEVRNSLKSVLKISSTSLFDSSHLMFSNRSGTGGTDIVLSLNGEEGLRFASLSDLPSQNNDNIMLLTAGGNVGIGTDNPAKAALVVNRGGAGTHAIFGDNTSGVSIQSNNPTIGFNSYIDASSNGRTLATGYAASLTLEPSTGVVTLYTNATSTPAGGIYSTSGGGWVSIFPNGRVGISYPNPSEKLHVDGNVRSSGLKINAGGFIELGLGALGGKETNAGKMGYNLFTTDALDLVGAGTTTNNRKLRFWAEGGSRFEGGLDVGGYTKMGEASPAIKTKVLTGTLSNPGSGQASILLAHNLNFNQIVSVNAMAKIDNSFIATTENPNYPITTSINLSSIVVASNSAALYGKKVRVFITYIEDTTPW